MIETIIPNSGIRTPDPDFSHRVGKSIIPDPRQCWWVKFKQVLQTHLQTSKGWLFIKFWAQIQGYNNDWWYREEKSHENGLHLKGKPVPEGISKKNQEKRTMKRRSTQIKTLGKREEQEITKTKKNQPPVENTNNVNARRVRLQLILF